MTYNRGLIWTPEKAIAQIEHFGVYNSRMFLRRSPDADNKAFEDVVFPLLPMTPKTDYGDANSFGNYLGDIAYRESVRDRIILTVMEATVTIKAKTCVTALREGIRMARPENQLLERVIPIIVIDENRTHTKYEGSSMENPEGPMQAFEQTKKLGGIAVKVSAETLKTRLRTAIEEILSGRMPADLP